MRCLRFCAAARNITGHSENLFKMFVEQQMIIAEMWPILCQWKFLVRKYGANVSANNRRSACDLEDAFSTKVSRCISHRCEIGEPWDGIFFDPRYRRRSARAHLFHRMLVLAG